LPPAFHPLLVAVATGENTITLTALLDAVRICLRFLCAFYAFVGALLDAYLVSDPLGLHTAISPACLRAAPGSDACSCCLACVTALLWSASTLFLHVRPCLLRRLLRSPPALLRAGSSLYPFILAGTALVLLIALANAPSLCSAATSLPLPPTPPCLRFPMPLLPLYGTLLPSRQQANCFCCVLFVNINLYCPHTAPSPLRLPFSPRSFGLVHHACARPALTRHA